MTADLAEVMADEMSRGMRKRVWPGFGYHVYLDLDKVAEQMRLKREDAKQWKQAVTTGLVALAAKKREAARAFFGI